MIIIDVEVKSQHRFEPRGVELFVAFGWADPVWNLTSRSCNSGGLHWLKDSVQHLSEGQSPILIISAPFTVWSHGACRGQIYNSCVSSLLLIPVNNMTGDTGSSGWKPVRSIVQWAPPSRLCLQSASADLLWSTCRLQAWLPATHLLTLQLLASSVWVHWRGPEAVCLVKHRVALNHSSTESSIFTIKPRLQNTNDSITAAPTAPPMIRGITLSNTPIRAVTIS